MTRSRVLLLVAVAAVAVVLVSPGPRIAARQALDDHVTVIITLETPLEAARALAAAAADAGRAAAEGAEGDAARGQRTRRLHAFLEEVTAGARGSMGEALRGRGGEIVYSLPFLATVVARVARSEIDGLRRLPGVVSVEAEVINISYGVGTFSYDDPGARFVDAIVDVYGKVVVVGAGNGGDRRTIYTPAIAHNAISVANMQDMRTASRVDDTIAPSSSRGQTWDGREKPDLAAPGSAVVLPTNDGSWAAGTGTSFAAAVVASAAALLVDAGVSDARAVKALLLHTADDYGTPGWDDTYGWGYLNLQAALERREHVLLATVTQGPNYFLLDAAAPAKVTAVWNRHIRYDIGRRDGAVVANPGFEMFAAADGSARAKSLHSGTVKQVRNDRAEATVLVVTLPYTAASEIVALAHSGGLEQRTPPGLALALSAPAAVEAGHLFTLRATVSNPGGVPGHRYRVSLNPIGTRYVPLDPEDVQIGTLGPGGSAVIEWRMRAPLQAQPASSLVVQAWSDSYDRHPYESARIQTATVGDCAPALSTSARVFTWRGAEATATVSVAPGCHWHLASFYPHYGYAGAPWPVFPGSVGYGITGVGPGTVRFVVPESGNWFTDTATLSLGWPHGASVPLVQGARPWTPHRTDFDRGGRDRFSLFRPASGEWLVEEAAAVTFGAPGDRPVPGDYDGDGVADYASYRPSDSTWRIRRSSDGQVSTVAWGKPGDIPVPADYTGDRRFDLAVFRPSSALWLIQGKGNVTYGTVGDIPVPGNYDHLGPADVAVFRPSTSTWFIPGQAPLVFGSVGDRPVPADYRGFGYTDIAVYRPHEGRWYVRPFYSGAQSFTVPLGQPGDVAAPQDVDGDGRAEPAVFRPSTATWEGVNQATGMRFSMSVGRTGDVVAAAAPAIPSAAPADTDGDRLADVTVFRPSDATWSTRRSSDLAVRTRYYGTPGDIPVPGDYLGTGVEQDAVYRPSRGAWFIQGLAPILFGGAPGDVPVPADYDGDGRLDVAVFRPSACRWYILTSASAFRVTTSKVFGGPGDIPLPADYDGDGRADVALFRHATVQWWVLRSSDGQVSLSWFGNEDDRPMPADYDGDGRADLAVYRPDSGYWFTRHSSSNVIVATQFGGAPGDVPVSLDYDGDGRADVAVYNSTLGRLDVRGGFSVSLGQAGDVPARTR